jgi:hypothetical protein
MATIKLRMMWESGSDGPYHMLDAIVTERERVLKYWSKHVKSPNATNADRSEFRKLLRYLDQNKSLQERGLAAVDDLNRTDFSKYADARKAVARTFRRHGINMSQAGLPVFIGVIIVVEDGTEHVGFEWGKDRRWNYLDRDELARLELDSVGKPKPLKIIPFDRSLLADDLASDSASSSALSEATKAAHFHSIRIGVSELLDGLDGIEKAAQAFRLATPEVSLTMALLKFELGTMRDLKNLLESVAPEYLLQRGDQSDEDIELYRRFESRRASLANWRAERIEKWRSLGYDLDNLVLDELTDDRF